MPYRSIVRLRTFLLLLCSTLPCLAQTGEYGVIAISRSGDGGQSVSLQRSYTLSSNGTLNGAPDGPMILATSEQTQGLEPAIAALPNSSILLATVSPGRDSLRSSDIRLRWIDSLGADRWNDSLGPGIDVARSKYIERHPFLIPLADSSVIVLYQLHYDSTIQGDVDIAAIRVRPDGTRAWSFWLAKSERQERIASCLPGANGSVLVVYESRTWSGGKMTGSDVLIQQIDSTGALGWKDSRDPVVIGGSKHFEMTPVAASDGTGGAYIAYEVEYIDGTRSADVDIVAQHVAWYGSRLWVDPKAPPYVSTLPGAREFNPTIAVDPHGITVGFEVASMDPKKPFEGIGLQRLDTAGHLLWNGGKRSTLLLVNGNRLTKPTLVAAPYRGVYVVFEAYDSAKGESNIIAQMYDIDGAGAWNNGTAPILAMSSSDNERSPVAALDMNGGLMIAAVREPVTQGPDGYSAVVATLITPDGAEAWTGVPTPVTLITSRGVKEKPILMRYR